MLIVLEQMLSQGLVRVQLGGWEERSRWPRPMSTFVQALYPIHTASVPLGGSKRFVPLPITPEATAAERVEAAHARAGVTVVEGVEG